MSQKDEKKNGKVQKQGDLAIHPYIGGTTTNLIANAIKNGGVSVSRVPAFLLTLVGTMITAPLRFAEYALYSRKLDELKFAEDPIFIVGHWRSGTTHLHNVISQDQRLGYLTTLQAVFPTCSILLSRIPAMKKAVAKLLPEKRMMDNVSMGIDFPQEEEFSVSCLTTSSHHCNHFPRTIRESFDKYVLMNMSPKEMSRWKRAYMGVIRKAAFMAGGRRLILKNPYSTARIETLLELFPNAKFIHIYRNPYNIYVSALHDFIKEAEEMALQEFTEEDFSALCYELYEKLMKQYWRSIERVPKGNLCEVSYEAFENAPMDEVLRIYSELGLDANDDMKSSISAYLQSISGYKKNKYSYNDSLLEEIGRKWDFAIRRMNYAPPRDISLTDDARWSCNMDY
jgi:omega-hydroxy-beta-dihydromenaquinone-9 sulfotransferase